MSDYHHHFHWFIAIVDSTDDPDKSGRVAIRNIEEQKFEPDQDPKDLFFAQVLMPPTGANLLALEHLLLDWKKAVLFFVSIWIQRTKNIQLY